MYNYKIKTSFFSAEITISLYQNQRLRHQRFLWTLKVEDGREVDPYPFFNFNPPPPPTTHTKQFPAPMRIYIKSGQRDSLVRTVMESQPKRFFYPILTSEVFLERGIYIENAYVNQKIRRNHICKLFAKICNVNLQN